MIRSLLLLLLLAPAAASAEPSKYDELKEVEHRIREDMPRLQASLDDLRKLTAEYPSAKDLDGLVERRQRTYQEGAPAAGRLYELNNRFGTLLEQADHAAVASALSGRGSLQAAIGESLDIRQGRELQHDLELLSREMKDVVTADNAAWKAALDARSRRRFRADLAIAAAAAVVLALGAALVLRRRRAKAAPPALVGPGMVLADNFRVVRELGRGGTGVIYEAEDLSLARKVAIRSVRGGSADAGQELQRALAEARLAAALKHPNIATVYDTLVEGDQLYLVSELVDGASLGAALSGATALDLDKVKGILRQTAEALDYAHSCRVLHRDLKPTNIFIEKGGAVKLLDFGVVRPSASAPHTAPELERGSPTPSSDLYSLGVVLYQMLTGRLPFPGPDCLAQKRRRLMEAPSKLRPGLPDGIDAVLEKALDPDPRARFRSGAELSEATDALV